LTYDADGGLEGQPLGLEEGRRHALAVADDRSEDDGPVDLDVGPRALARGCFRIGEDLGQVGVVRRMAAGRGGRWLLAEETRNVVAQPSKIDRIGDQNTRGIRVFREGEKEVLERDRAMRLARSVIARARERRDQGV
jgi:hypothetical protein